MSEDSSKAKSKSVSLLPDLWDKIEAVAEKSYGGNRSYYLRELVEKDMGGLSFGTPQSAFDAKQIAGWLKAERTLLGAGKYALSVLNGETPEGREKAARTMATLLLEGLFPEDQSEKPAGMVNEDTPANFAPKAIASLKARSDKTEPGPASRAGPR